MPEDSEPNGEKIRPEKSDSEKTSFPSDIPGSQEEILQAIESEAPTLQDNSPQGLLF
jgi:hypothetical protein